ncbi:MAG: hypothetical protein LBH75_08695 [Treponema sp.]|jgi:hypothetical protein|nr:hypothetical protein [Treponema sp.]
MNKLFLIVLIILTAACAKPEDAFVGTWKMTQPDGDAILFTFFADHTLNVNDEIWLKYFVTKDDKLILGEEEPVPYSIKNRVLRIRQEGLILTLVKQ